MFQRAVDLGLPASFVELRHEATHRELPSLTVLRNSTHRSLEWLWDFYWGKAEAGPVLFSAPSAVGEGLGSVNDDEEAIKASLRGALEQALSLIDGEGISGSEPPRKKRKVQQHLSSVATQVVSIIKGSRSAPAALAQVMLQDGILVPRGQR